jgi:hypothetical protein
MSIHDGGPATPHRLGRSLLVGVTALLAGIGTFVLMVVFLFDYGTTCEGWDNNPPADPGSGQAQVCDYWNGSLAHLFWVVPTAALVIAVIVGVRWITGRRHGAWFLVAVAALVLSPIAVSEALTWPGDTVRHHGQSERIGDAAGLR